MPQRLFSCEKLHFLVDLIDLGSLSQAVFFDMSTGNIWPKWPFKLSHFKFSCVKYRQIMFNRTRGVRTLSLIILTFKITNNSIYNYDHVFLVHKLKSLFEPFVVFGLRWFTYPRWRHWVAEGSTYWKLWSRMSFSGARFLRPVLCAMSVGIGVLISFHFFLKQVLLKFSGC